MLYYIKKKRDLTFQFFYVWTEAEIFRKRTIVVIFFEYYYLYINMLCVVPQNGLYNVDIEHQYMKVALREHEDSEKKDHFLLIEEASMFKQQHRSLQFIWYKKYYV